MDPSSRKSGRKGDEIKYPDIPSSVAPVKHSDDLPVPNPPARAGTSKNMEDVNVCDFEDEGILASSPPVILKSRTTKG